MMRIALALTMLVACSRGGGSRGSLPEPVPPGELFAFHSSFWVNLHERLWAESSPRGQPSDGSPAWAAALELYRTRWPERGLSGLFAEDVVALRATLQAAGERPDVDAELLSALTDAAASYRARGWPEDDAQNRAWIERLAPLLRRHGPTLAADLSRAYQVPWPDAPVRVEVSAFAGPVGAFTSLAPTRIAVASRDPRYQGDAALEMIFHEASHGLVEKLEAGIAAAAAARQRAAPPRLWHALLFFTTGELVARRLPPGYVPYARANGLYRRSPEMAAYERAMVAEWMPYLDGKIDLDAALANVVAALD